MNGIEAAFCGRVTSESIELKISKTTKVWAAFNVAIGIGDNVQWASVAVFEDLAARLVVELKKADRIYCEGTLRLESWSDKTTGEPRFGLSPAAWRVSRSSGRSAGASRRAKAMGAANGQPAPDGWSALDGTKVKGPGLSRHEAAPTRRH